MGYQQTPQQLPFAEGSTLVAGNTGTITLDQTRNIGKWLIDTDVEEYEAEVKEDEDSSE